MNGLQYKFRLVAIRTEQFAVNDTNWSPEMSEGPIALDCGFGCDRLTQRVSVNLRVGFEQIHDNPFLLIEASTIFHIDDASWSSMAATGSLVMPGDFALHLATLALGHVRGILHARTSQTPYSDIMVPLFDFRDIISGDVVLEL